MVEAGLDAVGVEQCPEDRVVLFCRLFAGRVLVACRQVRDCLHDLRGLHLPRLQLVEAIGSVEFLEEDLVLLLQRRHVFGVEVGGHWGHVEKVGNVVPLEELPLPRVGKHLLGEEVLVDLPLVDLLLDAPGQHQPVHSHVPPLADAPRALARLHVGHRVPVRVEDDHAVGPDDVEAHAADPRRQDHGEEVGVAVELLDHLEAPLHRSLAVYPQVGVTHAVHPRLYDLQHLDGLHEDEGPVALVPPELHDLGEDLHLPGPLEAPHVRGLELLVRVEQQEVRVVAELPEDADGEEDRADVLLLPGGRHRTPHLLRLQEVNVHLVLLWREVAEEHLLLLVGQLEHLHAVVNGALVILQQVQCRRSLVPAFCEIRCHLNDLRKCTHRLRELLLT
mmetsp:Transcript_78511/g.217066  ORF Transcript_78511/g.217066 Transcript_78511/m.217066 type:complete len:390 (-) Transcript_78511:511-1680(-)